MGKQIFRDFASDANEVMTGSKELNLSEQIDTCVWQIQFQKPNTMSNFLESTLHQKLEIGQSVVLHETTYLRFAPQSLYIVCREDALPQLDNRWDNYLTDISHGKCLFNLEGISAFVFVRDYCSIDLENSRIQEFNMAKTCFSDFQLVLWWQEVSSIYLLVDRSYSQAFVDLLRVSVANWIN